MITLKIHFYNDQFIPLLKKCRCRYLFSGASYRSTCNRSNFPNRSMQRCQLPSTYVQAGRTELKLSEYGGFLKGKIVGLGQYQKEAKNLLKNKNHYKNYYTSYCKLSEIKLLTIGIASPLRILQWAEKTLPNGKIYGEVLNANTLHHKTFKPQKGGLFCERIFGPLKDFECACGKIQKPNKQNQNFTAQPVQTELEDSKSARTCAGSKSSAIQSDLTTNTLEGFGAEKDNKTSLIFSNSINSSNKSYQETRKFCPDCDVEYTWSVIRRYQLGYIKLCSPVTHIWFLKGTPSYLSLLLNIKKRHLQLITYCSEFLTIEKSAFITSCFLLIPNKGSKVILSLAVKNKQKEFNERKTNGEKQVKENKQHRMFNLQLKYLFKNTKQIETPLLSQSIVKTNGCQKQNVLPLQLINKLGLERAQATFGTLHKINLLFSLLPFQGFAFAKGKVPGVDNSAEATQNAANAKHQPRSAGASAANNQHQYELNSSYRPYELLWIFNLSNNNNMSGDFLSSANKIYIKNFSLLYTQFNQSYIYANFILKSLNIRDSHTFGSSQIYAAHLQSKKQKVRELPVLGFNGWLSPTWLAWLRQTEEGTCSQCQSSTHSLRETEGNEARPFNSCALLPVGEAKPRATRKIPTDLYIINLLQQNLCKQSLNRLIETSWNYLLKKSAIQSSHKAKLILLPIFIHTFANANSSVNTIYNKNSFQKMEKPETFDNTFFDKEHWSALTRSCKCLSKQRNINASSKRFQKQFSIFQKNIKQNSFINKNNKTTVKFYSSQNAKFLSIFLNNLKSKYQQVGYQLFKQIKCSLQVNKWSLNVLTGFYKKNKIFKLTQITKNETLFNNSNFINKLNNSNQSNKSNKLLISQIPANKILNELTLFIQYNEIEKAISLKMQSYLFNNSITNKISKLLTKYLLNSFLLDFYSLFCGNMGRLNIGFTCLAARTCKPNRRGYVQPSKPTPNPFEVTDADLTASQSGKSAPVIFTKPLVVLSLFSLFHNNKKHKNLKTKNKQEIKQNVFYFYKQFFMLQNQLLFFNLLNKILLFCVINSTQNNKIFNSTACTYVQHCSHCWLARTCSELLTTKCWCSAANANNQSQTLWNYIQGRTLVSTDLLDLQLNTKEMTKLTNRGVFAFSKLRKRNWVSYVKNKNIVNVINKKRLYNNVYTLSHRERWQNEKDWQVFTLFTFTSMEDLDYSVINYTNRLVSFNTERTEGLGVNINALTNATNMSQSIKASQGIFNKSAPFGFVNKRLMNSNPVEIRNGLEDKGKQQPASLSEITRSTKIREQFEVPTQSESFYRFSKISSFYSGAGIVQQLINELNFYEIKKLDKQNRLVLYALNKVILKLKKQVQIFVYNKSTQLELKELCKKRDLLIRRTKLVRKLFRKNSNVNSMILTLIPVLPPDLRPIVKMGNQIAASDLNRLYQRVIYRNDRLKKFLKDPATSQSYEMKYAQRLLQESIDNLLQNGKSGVNSEKDARGRMLKSLSDILKGKQGRFRQFLLGKRVDYSGRSVIVVGPKLKLHECGLPLEMAKELYLPFLLKSILNKNYARTVIGAKTLIKNNASLTHELLREIMQVSPVLLNRAPTLHRLGIQAFSPKLVEGRAILLHPLVCSAFNADFDGDQMAVHIPITTEARAEAWKMMCAHNNILSTATGDPLAIPSQDMVLGCYYLTTQPNTLNSINNKQQLRGTKLKYFNSEPSIQIGGNLNTSNSLYYNSFEDVIKIYEQQIINVHTLVWVKCSLTIENGGDQEEPTEIQVNSFGQWREITSNYYRMYNLHNNLINQYVLTTPGRILFNLILQNIASV